MTFWGLKDNHSKAPRICKVTLDFLWIHFLGLHLRYCLTLEHKHSLLQHVTLGLFFRFHYPKHLVLLDRMYKTGNLAHSNISVLKLFHLKTKMHVERLLASVLFDYVKANVI